jgi:hypothetical protein
MELNLLNCFYLILPILAWNLVFARKLNIAIYKTNVSLNKTLEIIENILKYSTLMYSLFLPISISSRSQEAGIFIYLIGVMIYFISCCPLLFLPDYDFSSKKFLLFAPFISPIAFFTGIALMANSVLMFFISLIFVTLHFSNGLVKLKKLEQQDNLTISL